MEASVVTPQPVVLRMRGGVGGPPTWGREAPSKRISVKELKKRPKRKRVEERWGTEGQDRLVPLSKTGMARGDHR